MAIDRKGGGVLRGATLATTTLATTTLARATLAIGAIGAVVASTAPAATARAETGGKVHRITIERFAFRPATIEIRPGDTVEWVNRDTAPHTATSRPRTWDSGGLAKGRSYRRTFRSPGTVDYICVYHPHMRGRVIVTGR